MSEDLITVQPKTFNLVIEKSPFNLAQEEQKRKDDANIILAKKNALRSSFTPTSGSYYGKAVYLYRDNTNNCVLWVKKKTGINRTMGYGGRSAIQGHTPKIGAVGVLSGRPHAVLITNISGNMITFSESNYASGWITQRTLPVSFFLGYIYS